MERLGSGQLTIQLHIVFCLNKPLRVLALWQTVPVDADVVRNRNATFLQEQKLSIECLPGKSPSKSLDSIVSY